MKGYRGGSGHGDLVNQTWGWRNMGHPHPHFKDQSSEQLFSSTLGTILVMLTARTCKLGLWWWVMSVGEWRGRLSFCQEVICCSWGMTRKWSTWSFSCYFWDLLISFAHLSHLWNPFFWRDGWQMPGTRSALARLGSYVCPDVQYVLVTILTCLGVGRNAECPSDCLEVTDSLKLRSLSAWEVSWCADQGGKTSSQRQEAGLDITFKGSVLATYFCWLDPTS